MPFLRVDLAGPVEPDLRRALLARTAELFADITESPIERIRTQVHELPADSFAVGGQSIAESELQAPFITLDLLQGRPDEQRIRLIGEMSALVADLVGCPIERVRLRVNEVSADHWGIAGRPARSVRQREISERSAHDG